MTGMEGLRLAYGNYGANPGYALARRHMHLFKTTSEQLGAIAVSQRQWAQMNPWAQMRKPLTMEDYLNSRYIVEPFHLFDCCLVSNGGIAVIITSAERAKSLKRPPVYVPGMGQSAPENDQRTDREPGSPAVTASTPISRIRKRAASWSCETVTGALYCLAMTRRNSASSSLIRSPLTSTVTNTTGRRTRKDHTTPVYYLRDGDRLVLCNVNPGFERPNPWTLNLRVNPAARVQIGPVSGLYQAREASQAEVERYWPQLVQLWPAYQIFCDRSGQRLVFLLEPIR